VKDLKESLQSNRKPDITHVRLPFMHYVARPCEYGEIKYERANFMRSTGQGPHTTPTRDDFERLRKYLRAAMSHIAETLESMEAHQANDPNLLDVEGMKRAAYAVDTDVTPGAKVGASLLPHIAPACASLNMAITQAAACGLLPRDPGTPWTASIVPAAAPAPVEVPAPTPTPLDPHEQAIAALVAAARNQLADAGEDADDAQEIP
jgi:hypothetical protein